MTWFAVAAEPTPAPPVLTAPPEPVPTAFEADIPIPAVVPGHVAPAPGEHPRLFFRRGDLPELRRRAATPEGKQIVARLRELLGGGEDMPIWYSATTEAYAGTVVVDWNGILRLLSAWKEKGMPARTRHDSFGHASAAVAKAKQAKSDDKSADLESSKALTAKDPLAGLPPLDTTEDIVVDPWRAVALGKVGGGVPIGTYSISHVIGFGLLWQLTGDRKYAELGRRCFELALRGVRDRDDRYAWANAGGALRAGPAVGWYAAGYDLCADGWEPAERQRFAKEIQDYDWGPGENLADLAAGSRLGPDSNHWGPQIGGAALALLAIRGDPGTDPARIEELLKINQARITTQLEKGLGPGGYYSQGPGPGGITTDTAFVPALQAYRVAAGLDFCSPRRTASSILWIRCQDLTTIKGKPWYLIYPHGYFAGNYGNGDFGQRGSDRDGLSRGGQFCQGFGIMRDDYKPAALWVYENIVEPDPAKRTYDTVSPYAHRCLFALLNWPWGVTPRNPAETRPLAHFDEKHRYLSTRNRWKDRTDILISFAGFVGNEKDPCSVLVAGYDQKLPNSNLYKWGTCTGFKTWPDGSAVIGFPKGGAWYAIDFSGAGGAELLYVAVGNGLIAGKDVDLPADGVKARYTTTTLGGKPALILTFGKGDHPAPVADGERIRVGKRVVSFDGNGITVGNP